MFLNIVKMSVLEKLIINLSKHQRKLELDLRHVCEWRNTVAKKHMENVHFTKEVNYQIRQDFFSNTM